MKVLVLGGSRFVGRWIVEELCAKGHEPTLFHRGQSGPDFRPDLEHILGDRNEGFSQLAGREWDAVVDTSCYIPRHAALAGVLSRQVDRMLFVSTISVYAPPFQAPLTEESPVHGLDDPTTETVTAETYGGLKVICELECERAWGDRLLTVRPGLVAGPYDPTDRFTYWAARSSAEGAFASPPRLDQSIQFVDARDLAAFSVLGLEKGLSGKFNTVGPGMPFTFRDLFALGKGQPEDRGTDGLPMVVPPDAEALFQIRPEKAEAAGLQHTDPAVTIRDTLTWHQTREGHTFAWP